MAGLVSKILQKSPFAEKKVFQMRWTYGDTARFNVLDKNVSQWIFCISKNYTTVLSKDS